MNRHAVTVVEVRPEDVVPHPNADALSIVRIGGFQAVVRTTEWLDLPKLGAYIPPDSILPEGFMPDLPRRVRAVRLRGLYSEGLLVPAPAGSSPRDDVAAALGIEHYEPEPEPDGGARAPAPLALGAYDLDNARRVSAERFREGGAVIVTEKIHGQNWRGVWKDGRLHVGSRTRWWQPGAVFWQGVTSELASLIQAHAGRVFIGEHYGFVGGFPYDSVKRAPRIRIFDVWDPIQGWWSYDEMEAAIPSHLRVPELGRASWGGDLADFNPFAEGSTALGAAHIREGCVLRQEGGDLALGGERRVLKLVGRGYLARKGG